MAPGRGSDPVGTPAFWAFLSHCFAFHRHVTFLYFATKQVQFHQAKFRHHFSTCSLREYVP